MLALRRLATPRALPTAALTSVRHYSLGRSEGSVAQSREFGKKEKAHEDQYVKRHEAEQLAKLKASIEAKKAELKDLESQHEALEKNQK
ncbi:hypothetical protein CC2G_002124 [Coprinopsis cinerea AmutBmut pab1-1]|nr:hypothetical protein CC2G_002124 [Coprinopsis cinerea AmutBmut pab1-1]